MSDLEIQKTNLAQAAYHNRAEAISAVTPTFVSVMQVGDLLYEKDPSGNAIVQDNGTRWSPQGEPRLRHWGIVGAVKPENLETTDPSELPPDETAAIQTAFRWTYMKGKRIKGELGRWYGLSYSVTFGATSASELRTGTNVNATLEDFHFTFIGNPSNYSNPNFSSADADDWTVPNAVLIIGKNNAAFGKPKVSTKNVIGFGRNVGKTGIHIWGTEYSQHEVQAYNWTACQLRIGTGNDSGSCTDNVIRYTVYECGWEPAGTPGKFHNYALRTAIGVLRESADAVYDGCSAGPSKYCLVERKSYHAESTLSKHWAGPSRADASCITAIITKSAHNWRFTGDRFDDGVVIVEGPDGQFTGTMFIQPGVTSQLMLRATSANQTFKELGLIGCTLGVTTVAYSTRGAGASWADGVPTPNMIACRFREYPHDTDGVPVTIGGVSNRLHGTTKFGNNVLWSTGGLGLRDESSNSTRAYVGVSTDGWSVLAPRNQASTEFLFSLGLTFQNTGASTGRWYVGPPSGGNYVVTRDDLVTLGLIS